jgi:hypothetical protein
MNEDKDVEDSIGIEIYVLDVVILQHPLEELDCGECESTLHELKNIGISLEFFSIG